MSWTADWRPLSASENLSTSADPATVTRGPVDESQTVVQAKVDLPDIDFPSTRYYWTVVPVDYQVQPDQRRTSSKERRVRRCRDRRRMPARRVASRASARRATASAPATAREPRSSRACQPGRTLPQLDASATHGLLHAARRVGARDRSHRLSGAVVEVAVPMARHRSGEDVRDLGDPHPSVGDVVLPDPRSQPDADRRAEMAWSSPVAIKVATPKFTISGG